MFFKKIDQIKLVREDSIPRIEYNPKFKEIQKVNTQAQEEEENNFSKRVRYCKDLTLDNRASKSESQKDFDQYYRAYLDSLSDANQINIFDMKKDLMKPRAIERKLRDKFIIDL